MEETRKLGYNLQFFADETSGSSSAEGSNDDSNGNNEDQTQGNGDQSQSKDESGQKTFTQAELSAVAATEKKQGKQSILNMFGVKDEKTAKQQAEEFKKWQESQKTLETKLKDQESSLNEATIRAQNAENKLALITAGVTPESIDDVLAIALLKVSDDKDLNTVLEDMKKEPKYKGFFGKSGSNGGSNGTGTPAGHQGTGSGAKENLGERLGKARQSSVKKSNFFTN